MRGPGQRGRRPRRLKCGLAAWALLLGLAAFGAPAAPAPDDVPFGGPPERRAEAIAKAALCSRARERLRGTAGADSSYDVLFYHLQLDIDPQAERIDGTLAMRGRAVRPAIESVRLDLDDALRVDAVTIVNAPVSYVHAGGTLAVTLDRAYTAGEEFEIAVRYGGTPDPASQSFVFDTHAGQPHIWTLSEPYGARVWWPCKDVPEDKADSVDIDVTVPAELFAVCPGSYAGRRTPASGKTTYRWRERYPIATYLVSITAYPYAEQTVTYVPAGGGTMPVTVWSYPEEAGAALDLANRTLVMLRRDAALFGEYPFVREKYGYAQFPFGGGMEHQTVTSNGNWSTGLGVHETAHQWFGDAITCRTFADIWLNEGFATYAEALWDEVEAGPQAYLANLAGNRYYGPGTIRVSDPETTGFGRIFDVNLSYNKASWVLHMLRGVLGDGTFFRVLRTYAESPQRSYGTATTADFEAVAEAVSGRDLKRFFTQWIDRPYYPAYLYDYRGQPSGGGWDLGLDIEQLQTQTVYAMPLTVRVQTTAGIEERTIDDSLAVQHFDLHLAGEPSAVTLDPHGWVLQSAERAIHDPSFARGVLLVNGIAWWSPFWNGTAAAYAESVCTGGHPFAFWDCFPAPSSGYGAGLPPPLGHGRLPAELLAQFSTVVWVGSAYAGDLEIWNDASIVSYLRQGGNVLLLARRGQEFLSPGRAAILGLRWVESPVATLGAASVASPGFVPMAATDPQTQCGVFATGFDEPETQLLLTDATSFEVPRGIAAWRHLAGSSRASGGHLAFVSGLAGRWEHAALRANVRTILTDLFQEAQTPIAATLDARNEPQGIRLEWRLGPDIVPRSVLLLRADTLRSSAPLARWDRGARQADWLDVEVETGRRYRYLLCTSAENEPTVLAAAEIVRERPDARPRTQLFPIAPNPFRAGVVLRYEVARAVPVTLRVFDVRGRLVRTVLDAARPAGPGACTWDGRDERGNSAPAGVYWFQLGAGTSLRRTRATLVR